MEQLYRAALVGGRGVRADEFAEPCAVHVSHVRHVQDDVFVSLRKQGSQFIPQNPGVLAQCDFPVQIHNRDISYPPNFCCECHLELLLPKLIVYEPFTPACTLSRANSNSFIAVSKPLARANRQIPRFAAVSRSSHNCPHEVPRGLALQRSRFPRPTGSGGFQGHRSETIPPKGNPHPPAPHQFSLETPLLKRLSPCSRFGTAHYARAVRNSGF